jgi:hypothetical protein
MRSGGNHHATLVKADGKDILSVTMHLKAEPDPEAMPEKLFPQSQTKTSAWR